MDGLQMRAKLAISPLLSGVALPADAVTAKNFSSGQILSDHVGGVASIGLVVSGSVTVYSIALDGKDVQLNTLSPGECFGICNLYAKSELETVLRCAADTEVLYIPKSVALACMKQDTAFAIRYATLCNQKLQFLLQRIELLTMQSCRGRVIAYLLSHEDQKGNIAFPGSREELARYLGISRAALFRELSALQTLSALCWDGNTYTVLDRPKLEDLLYHPANLK